MKRPWMFIYESNVLVPGLLSYVSSSARLHEQDIQVCRKKAIQDVQEER
jgi:hypothetical protein